MTAGHELPARDQKALREEARRFVLMALGASVTMAALKIGVGLYSGSHALMVNAVYSINDVFSAIAVAVSLRVGHRKPCARYPYGYGKAEFVAVGLVSITIALFVCFLVLYSVVSIINGSDGPPHYVAAPLAALSMLVSWHIARSAHRLAQRLDSPALETSAEHFRSDALGSGAAIIGVGGALLGFHLLDPIVALIEELHLMALSGGLLGRATDGLMDAAMPAEDQELVQSACQEVPGVREVVHVRSRRAGSDTWVDVAVVLGARTKVAQTADIYHQIERAVRGVLGPAVVTQVQCQGPDFAFEAPGPGGSQH